MNELLNFGVSIGYIFYFVVVSWKIESWSLETYSILEEKKDTDEIMCSKGYLK